MKIANESITAPVRLEFNRVASDDTYDGIIQRGPNIWLVAPKLGKKRTGNLKVEREKDGRWTCSCIGWQKNRYVDCKKHIARVRFMIGEGGAIPYDGRRRRLATKVLYPDGRAEETRRSNARDAEPMKLPLLVAQLCDRFVPQPPRSETRSAKGGANGAPLRARAFSLLMKVFWNASYEQLHHWLTEQGTMWRLGFLKKAIPKKRAFVRWFGSACLTRILKRIFGETTKPTKRFDTMVIGDSHDIPTRMVDNSRDRKFGPRPAAYRNNDRPLVRQHFAVGKVSGIVYAEETTLTTGLGSGDGPHLRRLLKQTKDRTESVTVAAFDKSYTGKPNFTAAERAKIDLYVREKSGENRQGKDWPPMAQRLSKLERDTPAVYAETSRFRSKAELTPSRIKARNPYIRLRRRKGDSVPAFPALPIDAKISDLPTEVQDAIFDAATEAVGIARLNESLAILIIANLRTLNTLEHLYDQAVTFEEDITLNPPVEMRESDFDVA